MKYTEPLEFPGIDKVIEDIEFYKNKFIEDGILVFRNANLTNDEQEVLTKRMGDYFGWFPNTLQGAIERYTENHERLLATLPGSGNDDIILTWHIEHPYFDLPIAASTWNMYRFDANPNSGKTYFVDTAKLYRKLPLEWQEFLKNSVAYAYDYNYRKEMRETQVVKKHWLIDEYVIRFQIAKYNDLMHLKTFNGRQPTIQEKQKFLEITRYLYSEINDNLDNRIVHLWQSGDLVVPDMFKMAHAVTGGFDPKDREFSGLWLYAKDNTGSVK